ncbi:hypothetical protein [Alistipes sp. ZOR0009]|uniref:hypothetical protein n=1 Tax=Alistipes sp. ZOR0009 TaxID=1339253 RepID=UPI00064556EB|nr:hypothetical protein [Alistipes sp. ZOR0009]
MKLLSKSFMLFFCLISTAVFSQKNDVPGYILDVKGDTVKGYIDYRNWLCNPKEIKFKLSLDGVYHTHTPLTIKGFGTDDDRYESAIVEVETSTNNNYFIDYDSSIKLQQDTVFLQVIVDGRQKLYLNNTAIKPNFYISIDSTINLLVYKKYIDENKTGTVRGIAENNKYKGQLAYYFRDCPKIRSKINNLKYETSDLKAIFKFYQQCTNSQIAFEKKEIKIKPEFGIIGGLTVTNFNVKNSSVKFSNSNNLSGGVFLNIILPRNLSKFSIYNDLRMTSYNAKGTSHTITSSEKEEKFIQLSLTYIKLQNLVRAKFPLKHYSIFFNIGVSNGLVIKENKNKQIVKTEYSSTITHTRESTAFAIRKHEQGLVVGSGINYNNYSVEFRYEIGNGMSDAVFVKTFTKNFNFLLSYKL